MLKYCLLFLILTFQLQAVETSLHATIRLHGSDVFSSWLQDWMLAPAHSPEVDLELRFRLQGSHSGLSALLKGYADACLHLGPLPEPLPETFQATVIAHHVLHFFTHEHFALEAMTQAQIRRMATGQLSDAAAVWTELFPTTSDQRPGLPQLIIDRESSPVVLSQFKLFFSSGRNLANHVMLVNNRDQALEALERNDQYVYVTASFQPELPRSKRLSLVADGDSVAFPPSPENVRYGDYLAHAPIYLITQTDQPWTQTLIELFQSQSFAEKLAQKNLYPVL